MATEFKHTLAELHEYGKSVTREIKTRLRSSGRNGSGDLYDSIHYEITETNVKVTISFHMNRYGTYIDKGVQGSESGRAGEGGKSPYRFRNKMPPRSAFDSWLKIKRIPKDASYPIRRHIFKFGITPTNFFTIPTTRRAKQLEKDIRAAMIKDVEASMNKTLSKKKKRKKIK